MTAVLAAVAYAILFGLLAAIGSVILLLASLAAFGLMVYMAFRAGALRVSRWRARYNRAMRG